MELQQFEAHLSIIAQPTDLGIHLGKFLPAIKLLETHQMIRYIGGGSGPNGYGQAFGYQTLGL